MSTETVVRTPERQAIGCCEPSVTPRLSDAAAQQATAFFKVLADPARLQILDMLLQHTGELCVCEFEGLVGLPDQRTGQRPRQPTISHHLRVLREAGLLDCTRRGLWVYYFVRPERVDMLRAALELIR